jgi:hypothetical protein
VRTRRRMSLWRSLLNQMKLWMCFKENLLFDLYFEKINNARKLVNKCFKIDVSFVLVDCGSNEKNTASVSKPKDWNMEWNIYMARLGAIVGPLAGSTNESGGLVVSRVGALYLFLYNIYIFIYIYIYIYLISD